MPEMKYVATLLFACAVLHTFACPSIMKLANRSPERSMQKNLLHFLGEIEVAFGCWAALLIALWCVQSGISNAALYLASINYTEAVFVFVIMCMAATRPVLWLATRCIHALARGGISLYIACLVLGPLLGSLITEPAAMTVTALLLRDPFFSRKSSTRFKYATLGLLFVNISIGGTLTHFAAPPVLMVAAAWNWDSLYMLTHFGWRAVLAVVISTCATAWVFRKDLGTLAFDREIPTQNIPVWIVGVHMIFLLLAIVTAHHMAFFVPLFIFFLGWCRVAAAYQDQLRLKESLLVGFFLGGLVTLGKLQDWWLQPLLAQLDPTTLFWGATALTAITDNAALTYLGTLVPDLSDAAKYALVSGAVCGGGLTVIANAPNPAGFGLLRASFGEKGISPLGLFLAALPFTLIAAAAFSL